MIDPTLINNKGAQEPFTGTLLRATKGGITGTQFKYSTVQSRRFNNAFSAMPISYVSVTEMLKTSRIDLPFAIGDKITLHDGRTMNVQAVDYEHNKGKALMGVDSRERAILTLEGGGK